MAVKEKLKLVTLDGDETLYPDRRNFEDLNTAHYITTLLQSGVSVAVVTAAGSLTKNDSLSDYNVRVWLSN